MNKAQKMTLLFNQVMKVVNNFNEILPPQDICKTLNYCKHKIKENDIK